MHRGWRRGETQAGGVQNIKNAREMKEGNVGREICLLSYIGFWNTLRLHATDANKISRKRSDYTGKMHYQSPQGHFPCILGAFSTHDTTDAFFTVYTERGEGGGWRREAGKETKWWDVLRTMLPILRTDSTAKSHSGSLPLLRMRSSSENRTANLQLLSHLWSILWAWSWSLCAFAQT